MTDPTPIEMAKLTQLSEDGWTVIFSSQGWTGRNRFGNIIGPFPTAGELLSMVEKEKRWVQ